ncbi:sulfatase-like hydrolase/transferase [Haloarcula sp. GH36]|uniref:sulfatase-like hydrolase/transferase n=1 Tax=Haloarcula montana TaxID=3111776 RepID=UPI002D797C93|nr:sulfatase-like hydrolase/transferase [Haloarcula sp. GH36]
MTNVAVVVLDTVRADAFDEQFDWLPGARFDRAYSTSHWTVPAHASLFTGRYASTIGVHGTAPTLDCRERTLAEAFSDAGHRTRAFSANAQLNQYDGWDRGFDEFVRTANLGRTDDRIFDWGAHIEATEPGLYRNLSGLARCFTEDVDTRRSLRYGYELFRTESYDGGGAAIRKRVRETEFGEDELLFVNLMEAHTPYHPPPGGSDPVTVVVAEALAGTVTDPETVRAAYRESVRYLSAVYRDIHADLLDSFDYVVTLSDHGELLGEHDLWNHSISLHPELTRVPVVVSGEGIETTRRSEVVNLLDVHRTIAALADVPVESAGRDLFGTLDPRDQFVESHGLLPFHRAQFDRHGLSESLFDHWQTPLHGFVTPDGTYCYETDPEAFRCLGETALSDPKERLEELIEELDRQAVVDEQPEVTDEVKRRLEELGYA